MTESAPKRYTLADARRKSAETACACEHGKAVHGLPGTACTYCSCLKYVFAGPIQNLAPPAKGYPKK